MILGEVLDYIHNYFEKEIVKGKYTIAAGSINVNFLQNGQYFRIRGSVFNDGIYQYPTSTLVDETFVGEVWAMAVPPAVIAIASDIDKWMGKYGDALSGPYASESFAGYSYTKAYATSAKGGMSSEPPWKQAFGYKLIPWRKIS